MIVIHGRFMLGTAGTAALKCFSVIEYILKLYKRVLFRHPFCNITAVSFSLSKFLKLFSKQSCCWHFLCDIFESELVTSRILKYVF